MFNFPRMPQAGTSKIGGLYKTVNDICNILPSLVVNGDGRTTAVSHNRFGTLIHAIPPHFTGQAYFSGGQETITDPFEYNSLYPYMKNGYVYVNSGHVYIGDFVISIDSASYELSTFENKRWLFIKVYVDGNTIKAEIVQDNIPQSTVNYLIYRLCAVDYSNGALNSFSRSYIGGDLRIVDRWGI